jgi:hypothetical protein
LRLVFFTTFFPYPAPKSGELVPLLDYSSAPAHP